MITGSRYSEEEIDFADVSSPRFEELCFDLLVRAGFSNVVWRQGGGDSGRDIDAQVTINVPLIGPTIETWSIECKHYSGGVPQEVLAPKISWAEAVRPTRLVFFVSTHLTNAAREWLNRRMSQLSFQVHVVEGKQLKNLLLPYEDLVVRYFADPPTRLLRQSVQQWAAYGLYPSPQSLHVLISTLNLPSLALGELSFLWCMCLVIQDQIEEWNENNEDQEVSVETVRNQLLEVARESQQTVLQDLQGAVYSGLSSRGLGPDSQLREAFSEPMVMRTAGGSEPAVYAIQHDGTRGLEVLLTAGSHPAAIAQQFRSSIPERVSQAVSLLDEVVRRSSGARL